MKRNTYVYSFVAILAIGIVAFSFWSQMKPPETQKTPPSPLDPSTIPKFVNELPTLPVFTPTNKLDANGKTTSQEYTVDMTAFYEQVLPPGFPKTKVFGYGGDAKDPITGASLGYVHNAPGPTFEAVRGIPVQVTWVNKLEEQMFAVDPTLHWANPNNMQMPTAPFPSFPPGFQKAQDTVPTVVHLHGAEDRSDSDGYPESWFTANGIHGAAYSTTAPTNANSAVYYYPNDQPATTLWYHDHALGITRINILSGLAGFYLLKDTNDPIEPLLPQGKYDVPLIIQDRSFNDDGSMLFPAEGANSETHPYWLPEFFGDTVTVNGKVWPNLNVVQGQYRFRILDASNARFYNMSFSNGMTFTQIGSDGGYLKAVAPMTSCLIAPAERADILVDFSNIPVGTKVILTNDAVAPYPSGDPSDPLAAAAAEIMQFTLTSEVGHQAHTLPQILNPTLAGDWPTLSTPTTNHTLPFFELASPIDEPLAAFLNGQRWAGDITETPQVGSTEDWMLVDTTDDAHPIHVHLVQFQLVYRIPLNTSAYVDDWVALNGQFPLPLDKKPTTLDPTPYITGEPEMPAPSEMGWKDTIQAMPGYATVIRIRWAPITAPTTGSASPSAGTNLYSFDPTIGPGYVWHCHITDHEDNEMMRPYKVTP
ncbi:MAG: multicopper oxidase family protein [Candidatus Bathyarchaeia archaeon]